MTTRTFGFAYPLKCADVKAGMLISAQHGNRHVIGLAFQGEREVLLAVFADNGAVDPRPPYVLDLSDVHESLTLIPGEREFEPVSDRSFDLLPQRRSSADGFIITGTGKVGLAVTHIEFGRRQYLQLDFDTGEGLVHGGNLAVLPEARLFVVEQGRNVRREVTVQPAS